MAGAVDQACRDIGFLVISGHGVSARLIESMRRVSKHCFELPLTDKMRLKMPSDRYRGYTPMASESLAASLDQVAPPDLKESFSMGPVDPPHDLRRARGNENHEASRTGCCGAAWLG